MVDEEKRGATITLGGGWVIYYPNLGVIFTPSSISSSLHKVPTTTTTTYIHSFFFYYPPNNPPSYQTCPKMLNFRKSSKTSIIKIYTICMYVFADKQRSKQTRKVLYSLLSLLLYDLPFHQSTQNLYIIMNNLKQYKFRRMFISLCYFPSTIFCSSQCIIELNCTVIRDGNGVGRGRGGVSRTRTHITCTLPITRPLPITGNNHTHPRIHRVSTNQRVPGYPSVLILPVVYPPVFTHVLYNKLLHKS